MTQLAELLADLPEDLAQQVFTHASWSDRRSESYERLAFLGDSVLGLAVSTHLYPRLEGGQSGVGELTKVRAQAVSGRSCSAVAERLGVPERLRSAAPEEIAHNVDELAEIERVLASVIEAVIGACYLHVGYEPTAEAVIEAFIPEIDEALRHPTDFKSALQEALAQQGDVVTYTVTSASGPPHARIFEVTATVGGRSLGNGSGPSKKQAEQEAARAAMERLHS
jgi:ribonuclease III